MCGQKYYVAKKHDNIDNALAKYLNSIGDKLKISFIRESQGVYKFGTKRVILNLERGEDLYVRIGGAYMHIKLFLDQYSKVEVDRIERNYALLKFHASQSQVMNVHKVFNNDRSMKSMERKITI
jgi:hypothetical protein